MAAPDRDYRHPAGGSSRLTTLVLLHFGVFMVFITWAFGGQAPWARQVIALWGTVGIVLFAWAARAYRGPAGRPHPALRLLWPLWLYDVLVISSCFNPGFREMKIAGEMSLVLGDPLRWLPSAAVPRLAAHELWQFNGLVLSSFNLLLVLQRRSQVRTVLFIVAGNAVALAVFGTFQKLAGAPGLWFGLVPSPNPRFFSTFIYHNHWGAFCLLALCACLALLFHFQQRGGHRDIWHSPVLLGAVATLLLATSVPLSSSRSCTFLAGLLLGGALVHLVARVIRHRRERQASVAGPAAVIALAVMLAAGGIGYLGRGVIAERSRQTEVQLARAHEENPLSSRLVVYRDTWRMAAEKPWFGWGLESYARVFRIFNTHRGNDIWAWASFYAEAHNDWLQSLAEVGFVGTGCLVLLAGLPLGGVRWRRTASVVPRYLLAGCGLLALYAWIEFPFANPAVTFTFCTVFYAAVRYAELDARPAREPHA
jgi:O-antigen ligase